MASPLPQCAPARQARTYRDLGFDSYDAYLRSPHWKQFKASYKASGRSMRCAVCNHGPIQLHHHTYERIGQERLTDVTPLCGTHHQAVHDWLKERKLHVSRTASAVAFLKGEPRSGLTRIPPRWKKKKGIKKGIENELRRWREHQDALDADTIYAAAYARWLELKYDYPECAKGFHNVIGKDAVEKILPQMEERVARRTKDFNSSWRLQNTNPSKLDARERKQQRVEAPAYVSLKRRWDFLVSTHPALAMGQTASTRLGKLRNSIRNLERRIAKESAKAGTAAKLVPVTVELLQEGQGDAGGWNAAQLRLLGAQWPPSKGWKESVIGHLIPAASAIAFVRQKTVEESTAFEHEARRIAAGFRPRRR